MKTNHHNHEKLREYLRKRRAHKLKQNEPGIGVPKSVCGVQ